MSEEGTNLERGHTIRQGGILVFAQEQDSVGGDFDTSQSFQGKLSGVHVWDHVLTSAKIKEMSTTCVLNEDDDGNVFNWLDILREGEIRLVEPFTCEPIEKGMRVFTISPYNCNTIIESHKLSARSIFHKTVQRQNMLAHTAFRKADGITSCIIRRYTTRKRCISSLYSQTFGK